MSDFHLTANNFKTHIRRSNREKIMAEKRRIFHYSCPSLQQIALSLNLTYCPSHGPEELLKNAWIPLLNFSTTIFDEEQGKGEHSKIAIDFIGHLNFWSLLVHQLSTGKYYPSFYVIEFISKYLDINAHQVITQYKIYSTKVIQALELIIQVTSSEKLKQAILQWITCCEGIPLAILCISSQYYNFIQIRNILKVIEEGLKSLSNSITMDCIHALDLFLKRAKDDDLSQIFSNHVGIMVTLLQKACLNINQPQIEQISNVIINLFPYHSLIMLEYLQIGVGFLAGQLIRSSSQIALLKGLEMIKFITMSECGEIYSFLFEDKDFKETGVWNSFRSTSSLYQHSNIEIRKMAFIIVANILYRSPQKYVNIFCVQVLGNEEDNLLNLFGNALNCEDDITIIDRVLICLNTLIYYGEKYQGNQRNLMIVHIYEKQIDILIDKLTVHSHDGIAEKAEELKCIIKNNY